MARPLMVSRYFALREFNVSESHPALVPSGVPHDVAARLQALAVRVLDPLRAAHGAPVRVLSGWRAPALNVAVGGSPTSQHVTGDAADVRPVDGPAVALFKAARELARAGKLACGQVIYYPAQDFVHLAAPSARYPVPTFCIHDPDRGRVYAVVERVTTAPAGAGRAA